MEQDQFKTNQPLYNHNIEYDILKLPKKLQKIINELEKFDKVGDWFNYDMKFPILDIEAKSCWRTNKITENDYKTILKKYGGIYD